MAQKNGSKVVLRGAVCYNTGMEPRRLFDGRVIGAVVLLLVIGGVYVYLQVRHGGEHAYRCGDGTEFSVTPAEDFSSVTLYPTTNVERIPQSVLAKVESDFGARYANERLVMHGRGEMVQLIGQSFSTTCTPVTAADEAPINWGE